MMRRLSGFLILAGLAGCATNHPPIAATPQRLNQLGGVVGHNLPPANPDTDLGAISRPLPGVSYGRTQPITLPATAATTGGNVTLNFADTDIRTVIAQVLGTILHVNYTIDPSVHGTATFHTTTPLARAELVPVLQALLGQNGAALVQTGTLYRVVPAATAASTTSLAGSTAVAGSTLVPLRYASAANLAKTLQPFIGPGGKIVAAPEGNAVLIAGDPATRATLMGLVHAFDSDILAGQSYALLPVKTGDAKSLASSLQTALAGKTGLAGVVRIVPLVHVDAVLVVARRARTIADVERVFELIERNQAHNVRSWHVYYLQDSRANDLAYVLQEAFTPDNVTATPSGSGQAASTAPTGAASGTGGAIGMSGAIGTGSTMASSGLGSETAGLPAATTGAPATTAATTARPAASANPLLGGLGGGGSGSESGSGTDEMRIIPDSQNNALLIYATQSEDALINAMLRKIDILPLEVRIDATIAEVDLDNALQYGTQFFFQSAGGINGILNNATSTLTTPANVALDSNFPGFVLGGTGTGGAPLAISALQQVTKVQVLSSPELLVLNGHTASLQVGSLVPYLTSSSQSTITSGAPVISSIQYQPTGVIMQVTPHVNRDGLVELNISQSVSSVQSSTSSTSSSTAINSPTFLQRSISSSVVVQDGQTVGLAGLISDNLSRGNSGIPWLKDIPILGALAGTQTNTRTRTELLVLLTPHVVYNQHDVRALTEDIKQALPYAATVPLNLSRPSEGLADPNLGVRHALQIRQ